MNTLRDKEECWSQKEKNTDGGRRNLDSRLRESKRAGNETVMDGQKKMRGYRQISRACTKSSQQAFNKKTCISLSLKGP